MQYGALALYAVLTLLSFPHELPGGGGFDLGLWLAWFGPAALIVGIEGLTPGQAWRAAFLASLCGHAILFHWFFVVTVVYGGMPTWLGVLSPLVPSIYVSLFSAAFAWAWTRLGGIAHASIWAGATCWVAIDWVRGQLLGGFPWATLGYALHLDLPLLVWTRWTGVYGLSFMAVLVGIAVAGAWLTPGRRSTRRLGVTVACVAAAHAVGIWQPRDEFDSATTVRIAAVQGNIDQGAKWDGLRRRQILDTYLRQSTRAVHAGARWIVWPETAVPGLIEADSALRQQLSDFASLHAVWLIVGATGVEFDQASGRFSAFFDSAFVFDSAGQLGERYDKTHLVPFGEFVPLRAWLGRFFQSLARGLSTTDITPGQRPRTISIDLDRVGGGSVEVAVPICYELLFPDLVRRFSTHGTGVMLAITNDAWYGRTGAPHQFLAMTALRAAENGRWVVRAANTGISAVIDARGRVRQTSALFEEDIVVADVPVLTSSSPTLYTRFGDVFAGVCALGSMVLFGLRAYKEQSART